MSRDTCILRNQMKTFQKQNICGKINKFSEKMVHILGLQILTFQVNEKKVSYWIYPGKLISEWVPQEKRSVKLTIGFVKNKSWWPDSKLVSSNVKILLS